MDDADERGRAEGHGRRTAKDLDALDVAKAQGRQRRIERATPGNIVDDQQERVELAKPPELGDRSCRSRVAARCDLDARRESQRILERCRSEIPQVVARQHFNRGRHLVWRLGEARRDHFHFFRDRDRRRRRLTLSLCPSSQREYGGTDTERVRECRGDHARLLIVEKVTRILIPSRSYYQESLARRSFVTRSGLDAFGQADAQ